MAPDAGVCEKIGLRTEMRCRRALLARAQPDAAAQAAERLPLERFAEFAVVGGYRPQGAEFDPGPILRRLEAGGAVVAMPSAPDRHSPLAFRAAGAGALTPDAFGILSPPPHLPELHPDVILAPILAFDGRGGRLGQGAGCYDRTLECLRARESVWVVGLAYAGQEISEAPAEAHDQRLDAILTEKGYREF